MLPMPWVRAASCASAPRARMISFWWKLPIMARVFQPRSSPAFLSLFSFTTALLNLRSAGLLRFLDKQARHQTFSCHKAPDREVHRAGRELVLVLRRRSNV